MPQKHLSLPYFATVALLLGCGSFGVADETYLLRFKFQPSQQLKYRSLQTLTQTAASPVGTKLDVSKTDQLRVFTIGNVAESGEAEVSMQYEHVRMESQSNDNESIVFDSSMPAEEVPSIFRSIADKLKGAAEKYELSPKGTPVSADGTQEIPSEGQASFMLPLPEGEVKIGDTWKVEIPVRVRIAERVKREVRLLRSYRLKSVDDGIATISFSTSISTSVKNPSVIAQLIQSTPSGTISFDVEKGLVTRRVMKVNRTVVGALGVAKSVLSSVGQTKEVLVSEDTNVTARCE